jgi:hypothetical protein
MAVLPSACATFRRGWSVDSRVPPTGLVASTVFGIAAAVGRNVISHEGY